jgi:4-hydroxy-3-methylbut-2-enyl diphosphate reductase
VIRADVLGTCFGVRDALQVLDGISEPETVTIYGQLVHNEIVQRQLAVRGFAVQGEADRRAALPATPAVLVTAHGISEHERQRLESAGKHLLDTTCPLVQRVHHAAQALEAEGYFVLVIGRRGHVEVDGIIGDLVCYEVIESPGDVITYPHHRLGIVCQSTASERRVGPIRATIAERNPDAEIRFVDTICLPTKEHQRALERLLDQVDAVVVVGGHNSNNTHELVACCRERGRPALHVQSAGELVAGWFDGFATVGLTAGTSTLPATIDDVERALAAFGNPLDESGESVRSRTSEPVPTAALAAGVQP